MSNNLPFAFFSDSIDDTLKFGLNNNLRITNQRGVFTWNSDPTLPLEHAILNGAKEESKDGGDLWVCGCININKNLATANSGLTRSSLLQEVELPTALCNDKATTDILKSDQLFSTRKHPWKRLAALRRAAILNVTAPAIATLLLTNTYERSPMHK